MYKLCKTEQSAARQQELERGLMEMMNTTQYEDITVSDLCQQMQIPRKSFYRYFSSKDGALHAMIDHTLLEYESFGAEKGKQKRTLMGELSRFFEFWFQHRLLLDALAKSNLSGVLIERSIDYAVSETVFPNRFFDTEDLRLRGHVVQFAVCGLMSMVLRWHHGDFSEKISEMAAVAVRLLDRPLFPNVGELL